MDSEEKQNLRRSLELGEENNKMLKRLVRSMRWARLIRVIYWLIIIGASLGALYFFQPYIDRLVGIYQSVESTGNKINTIFSP